jgi:hypothetical protein
MSVSLVAWGRYLLRHEKTPVNGSVTWLVRQHDKSTIKYDRFGVRIALSSLSLHACYFPLCTLPISSLGLLSVC